MRRFHRPFLKKREYMLILRLQVRMKNTVKLREIEREAKLLFTTVSFQLMFSFLMHASLPHIFCKTR